ncbi:MAG: phosphodiester glycosidase family protein [Sphingobacteriales bacterium]|jgi:exopolysaccharide biosynthesis protein|nr:phosphodiester glycosidase family protein [Sphingobacteriales bacterium]
MKDFHRLKKLPLLLIFNFLFFTIAIAQNDSLIFANAHWNKKRIGRGVRLYNFHFKNKELFNANQNVSFVVFNNRFLGRKAAIAAEPKRLRTTSDLAFNHHAISAINGNFFDMKNGGSVDFTRQEGKEININSKGKEEKLAFHQKAGIVIKKGNLSIIKWDGLNNWADWITEKDVMLNGPLLRYNNQNERLDSVSFNINRHPRTCVGIKPNGKVIMIVVDGRNANSAGMSLFELAKIMAWLGCTSAINFDGGGSSTLWIKQKGVINYPSDNGKWDRAGHRKVANILYIK